MTEKTETKGAITMKILNISDAKIQEKLRRFFEFMGNILSEKQFRLLLGAVAILLGPRSISFMTCQVLPGKESARGNGKSNRALRS